MSLPCGFKNSQEYFDKCLEFLAKYCWIYETSNTAFVRNNVLDKFPIEWINYFTRVTNDDLNKFPIRQLKTDHSSLNTFIQQLNYLIPKKVQISFTNSDYKFKKMSEKKQHEILRLSCLIKRICSHDIDILIDFGSGLGYLSELLHKENAYKIIGIESDAKRVQSSRERQTTTYPFSKNDVVFKEHFITEGSKEFISHEVELLFPELKDGRLAIIGLHSCADLTINSMKLFFRMENVKNLIIMPCCYHKLETKTESIASGFKNFPLSNVLKTAEEKRKPFSGFNRPFLRLACQRTSAYWMKITEKEHNNHGADMFLRGVAEAIINDDEMVEKSKRKMVLRQSDFSELTSIYELHSKKSRERISWTGEHNNRFLELMERYSNGPKLAEGLTCLQTSIQELCENVVLYDRLCWMEEQAIEANIKISVKFEKIMDELVSPRGYVLIAQKL